MWSEWPGRMNNFGRNYPTIQLCVSAVSRILLELSVRRSRPVNKLFIDSAIHRQFRRIRNVERVRASV